jgi:hypothetical protein
MILEHDILVVPYGTDDVDLTDEEMKVFFALVWEVVQEEHAGCEAEDMTDEERENVKRGHERDIWEISRLEREWFGE